MVARTIWVHAVATQHPLTCVQNSGERDATQNATSVERFLTQGTTVCTGACCVSPMTLWCKTHARWKDTTCVQTRGGVSAGRGAMTVTWRPGSRVSHRTITKRAKFLAGRGVCGVAVKVGTLRRD